MNFRPLLILVSSACLAYVTADCDLPPSLWCSNEETSRRCGVEKQCLSWGKRGQITRLQGKIKPVNVTLAYEAFCRPCRIFILRLIPVYEQFKEYMTVKLLPHGNAKEAYDEERGMWNFKCQFGPKECMANLIETCAIFLAERDEEKYLPFIGCMEASIHLRKGSIRFQQKNPLEYGKQCAEESGYDWKRLSDCVNGREGNGYQHIVASETPKHFYVPWVMVNGISTENIRARSWNLERLVCDLIPQPKPAQCSIKMTEERCLNDNLINL